MASPRLLRKLSWKKMLPKSIATEGTASDWETAKSSFKRERYGSYASGDTHDFEFDNSDTESSAEPFSSPVSDIRWSGTALADRRSFDGVVGSADKIINVAKQIYVKKIINVAEATNEQNGDGLSSVAVLAFEGLFFLLLMFCIFLFAW